jgi:hypothetical protein
VSIDLRWTNKPVGVIVNLNNIHGKDAGWSIADMKARRRRTADPARFHHGSSAVAFGDARRGVDWSAI